MSKEWRNYYLSHIGGNKMMQSKKKKDVGILIYLHSVHGQNLYNFIQMLNLTVKAQ